MAAYQIEALTFTYPLAKKKALDGVTFSVEDGEFLLLCGKSGCGKSTLLRQLKTVLAPHGKREGRVLYGGKPLDEVDFRTQSAKIGFVMQNPENQTVTDKVWHELAFGLESLGLDTGEIRLRVAEMANFFGIQTWFHKSVAELSGGQKQLLNLASVMAMHPDVLILDEPTSQLDPIAAAEFLDTVKKLNRETGVTVILSEHRLEEAFPLADRVLVMEERRVAALGTPAEVARVLREARSPMEQALPAPMRVYGALGAAGECPITVRDGRRFLEEGYRDKQGLRLPEEAAPSGAPALELREVWFRYRKDGGDVLRDLSLKAPQGSLFAVVGGNGSGKSTMLSVLCGLQNPVTEAGVSMLPQDPQTLFVKSTVAQDLEEVLDRRLPAEKRKALLQEVTEVAELSGLLDRHPYDLSGGEQQRAALAKVLLLEPKILLLDEPTKGMDAPYKERFAALLRRILAQRKTIVLVSHDVEFCAEYADLCAMFFDGSIIAQGTPRRFFSGNTFYTSAACRMAHGLFPNAVTCKDVIQCCQS